MLKDLIATPGEAIVGRLAKQYRIDADVHALLAAEIDKAVAVEREACARIAESLGDEQDDEGQAFYVALKIAADIRARSNNSN